MLASESQNALKYGKECKVKTPMGKKLAENRSACDKMKSPEKLQWKCHKSPCNELDWKHKIGENNFSMYKDNSWCRNMLNNEEFFGDTVDTSKEGVD